MTPTIDLPNEWKPIIILIISIISALTFIQIGYDTLLKYRQDENRTKIEMSKRGYCLQPIPGSVSLQYLPCIPK